MVVYKLTRECCIRPMQAHKQYVYRGYLTIAGGCTLTVGGHSFPLRPLDAAFCAPLEDHGFILAASAATFEHFDFIIEPERSESELLDALARLKQRGPFAMHADWLVVLERARQLHSTERPAHVHAAAELLTGFIYDLVSRATPAMVAAPRRSPIAAGLEYLYRHPNASLDTVAGRFHVSVDHLRHELTRSLGVSPKRYVKYNALIGAALDLLYTDSTVAEVARRHDFEDPSQFSRAFKRVLGLSPQQYRHAGGHTGREGSPQQITLEGAEREYEQHASRS